MLDRLSVFAGGWTLEAAEAVTSAGDTGEWQVLDHLAALVDKSLVQAEEIHGSTRYRLLETVRHYAAERLACGPAPSCDETRAAHRDHYLALVETAGVHLRGPDEAVWLDRLEVEFDNIRAALAFSIADPDSAEPGLRLAAGLRWFCNMRGHGGEVLEALSALLERPDARHAHPRPGPGADRELPPAQSLRRRLGDPVDGRRGHQRSPAASPMTRSPPTPCPSCAGSGSSTATCLPHWPRSTRRSRWPGQPEIPGCTADLLGHRAVFKGEGGRSGRRLR